MAHVADHCAVCHANNGHGQTMFGKAMCPKPPVHNGMQNVMETVTATTDTDYYCKDNERNGSDRRSIR